MGPLKKIVIVAFGIFSLLSLLVVNFFVIQILDGDKWSEVAEKQHFFSVKEPFLRGSFWSNTGIRKNHPDKPQRFVLEIQKFHLYVDPLSIPAKHHDEISDYIKDNIPLNSNEVLNIRDQFDKKSRSRRLVMWLDPEIKDSLAVWWSEYARKNKIPRNALYFVPEYKRSYPFGKLLGQVLHTVQEQRDEATKEAYPTGGLELYFNSFLKGKQGKRILKRSPRHFFETGRILTHPEDGADVYLTINHYLQAIVEEELEIAVHKSNAKGAWAVMMEPNTGEILALAQYPFFFPSDYTSYFNDPEKVEYTRLKAITDANEPGSVFKPITAMVALLANEELIARGQPPLFDPEKKMPCSDSSFPGRRKPLTDVNFHKYLNMNMAIQRSSNIYVARLMQKVIERLGKEWYRDVLEQTFGFGLRTHIELPSESPGVLPRPGKYHPNGAPEWSVPTPFSLAIGHNIQVNSIQLAVVYSMLANGGKRVEPTLIRKIVKKDSEGGLKYLIDNTRLERSAKFRQAVPSSIIKRVVEAIRFTTKPGGSAPRADIVGYTEAGKTGTAHKIVNGSYSQTRYLASFIGFTPVKNPAFVLLVSIDEPEKKYIPGVGRNYFGSIAAAPVFKAISTRALEYLGVDPDDPYSYPDQNSKTHENRGEWIPEIKKLQALYEEWNIR